MILNPLVCEAFGMLYTLEETPRPLSTPKCFNLSFLSAYKDSELSAWPDGPAHRLLFCSFLKAPAHAEEAQAGRVTGLWAPLHVARI